MEKTKKKEYFGGNVIIEKRQEGNKNVIEISGPWMKKILGKVEKMKKKENK